MARDHIKLIKIQEQARKKLEAEVETCVSAAGQQRKQIAWMEKERDRLVEEQLDLTSKIEDIMEDIRLKKVLIHLFDLDTDT